MIPNPAPMQVPPIEEIQEIVTLFKTEQSIDQVNYDLVNIITFIGQNIKAPGIAQQERERLFSYMLQLQKIYRFINDICDIVNE